MIFQRNSNSARNAGGRAAKRRSKAPVMPNAARSTVSAGAAPRRQDLGVRHLINWTPT
jgi:hypothetical protein